MKIFRHLKEVPQDFGPTIVSVGNFDGVHRAHQAVMAEVVRRAKEQGVSRVVFDRGGYAYHGRVAALAEGAREIGLDF